MKKTVLSFLSLILTLFALAQDSTASFTEREATGLRAEGKIYVVLAVVLIILAGLFAYLIRLDQKIRKIEKSS